MIRLLRAGAVRLALVGLLVGVYVGAWRPARALLAEHVARPALERVQTSRAAQFDVTSAGVGVTIRNSRTASTVVSVRTPAGILFLLPGALLLLAFPWRPYWLYLWLYQMALGALMLGALGVGIGWSDIGFTLHRFLSGDVYMGTSLAAPLLAYAVHRRRSATTDDGAARSSDAR